jgi:U32 family peptidase
LTELLAPAGNLEKMYYAANFGADAVYFGLKQFSLRGFADNFSLEEAEQGLAYLHERGKRGFLTLNIYPFEDEYPGILETAKNAEAIGVDALIVSDLGVVSMLTRNGIKTPIHISTQANTLSPQTVKVYGELGAKRVNLARELSFEQVSSLQKAITGSGIETEVFVHGSVCFSYSGRCSISDYLTGRHANRGECTHPCRWKYHLVEEKRPGEFMPVFEDERGQYLMNSKDLALYPFIGDLMKVGVDSFKIEGRMKSIHYIASIVALYRKLIDGENISKEDCVRLLGRVKNRGYSSGFMKGSIEPDDYKFEKSTPDSYAVFLGNIQEERFDGKAVMNVRNKIFAGDKVEILRPDGSLTLETMPEVLSDIKGEQMKEASHSKLLVLPFDLSPYTIIRRIESVSS